MNRVVPLATGAGLRLSGPEDGPLVLFMNGGSGRLAPGTWSATVEWLVGRLRARLPEARFGEVRYRVRSWRRLGLCVEDGAAALRTAGEGAPRAALVGFSMGGAVAISVAGDPRVTDVVGMAPWIPDELDLSGLAGRRLTVVQGQVDGVVPGVPGIRPADSRRGFDRARAAGVHGSYTLIRGGLHGTALRAPWGSVVTLPRARAWERLVGDAVERAVRRA